MPSYSRLAFASLAALVLAAAPARAQEPEPEPIATMKPPTTKELAEKLSALLGRPGGLSSSDAAKRAVAKSPTVAARETRIAVAEEEETTAILGFVPRATITARYTRYSPITPSSFGPGFGSLVGTSSPAGLIPNGSPLFAIGSDAFTFPVILDNYLLQTSFVVPISDIPLRALHNYRAAKHDREAADVDVKVSERNVALQAKLAYWDWVRAAMDQVVADQTLAQSKVQLEATKALEEAGRASPADVLQAEARVSQAKLLADRAKNGTGSALDRLHVLMHDDSRDVYEIAEDPTIESPMPAQRPLPDLYADAVHNRPEVSSLDAQSRTLVEQREAAKASMYPQLSAFADFIYANPNPRFVPQIAEFRGSWDVGVQLVWSPNDVPASLAAANTLEARRKEIAARRDELAEAIENEVRDADLAVRDAKVSLENTETGIAAAEEAYRIRVERYRYGRATPVELAESETALLRARLERVAAQVGMRAALARLAYALGR